MSHLWSSGHLKFNNQASLDLMNLSRVGIIASILKTPSLQQGQVDITKISLLKGKTKVTHLLFRIIIVLSMIACIKIHEMPGLHKEPYLS